MTEQQQSAGLLTTDDSLPQVWGRRHALLAMCFLAMFIAYTDRVNISVASVAMREQLGWTQTVKGIVLTNYFAAGCQRASARAPLPAF
jgi:hypothetical protein